LEKDFDQFVRDDRVNEYLQTVGPAIFKEFIDAYGFPGKSLLVSGYEPWRENWATAYKGQVRFGSEIHEVDGINRPLILTPNVFSGKNTQGEDVKYCLGLSKGEKEVHVFPVMIKETGDDRHQAEILSDLCVIHNGVHIDAETAEKLGQENINQITNSQRFTACFWNIDDYIRKQNPEFKARDAEVWEAVEAFSGRIIDQMLHNISEHSQKKPEWMIPKAEELLIKNLAARIKNCFHKTNEIKENQLVYETANLCSYSSRFRNYQPLFELLETGSNILPSIIKNFKSPGKEVRQEALEAYQAVVKNERTAGFVKQEGVSGIVDLFKDQNPDVRYRALWAYQAVVRNERTAGFVKQEGVSGIVDLFKDQNPDVRQYAINTYKTILKKAPQFIQKQPQLKKKC
jgi:hypothetical protein